MTDTSGRSTRTRPHLLVLVGFMGAGKTSVGRELAKFLAWEFVDLDDVIEEREQRTVQQIFADEGEPYFRKVEMRELQRMLAESDANKVVSVGGGAFTQPGCAELVADCGATSILLDAPVEELRRRVRMSGNVRPLAADRERFVQLYADRKSAYEKANQRFDTAGKTVARVAREIAEWVRTSLTSPASRLGDGGLS
jgi:shikimate kinase